VDISENTSEIRALQKNNPRCYSINRLIYSETKLNKNKSINVSDKVSELNPLAWPVNPINGISAYYKDQEYLELFKANHNAIDIKVPQ